MENVGITVKMDALRLDALKYFLSQKEELTPQQMLERALAEMYEKYVPEETRGYLDSRMPSTTPKPRLKRTGKPHEKKEAHRDKTETPTAG